MYKYINIYYNYTCFLTSGTLKAISIISSVGIICQLGVSLLSALNIVTIHAFGFISSAICTNYTLINF